MMPLPLPDFTLRPKALPSNAQPLNASKADVVALAAACAASWGYTSGDDLKSLLKQLQVRQRFDALPFGESSTLLHVDGPALTVHIGSGTGPTRERFETVRALAHWVLHFMVPNQRDAAGLQALRVDHYDVDAIALREAHWFTFEFLMPEQEVRDHVRKHGDELWSLAARFNVSGRHAMIRLKALGLITPDAENVPTSLPSEGFGLSLNAAVPTASVM